MRSYRAALIAFGAALLVAAFALAVIMRSSPSNGVDEPRGKGVILVVRPSRLIVKEGEPIKFRVELHNRTAKSVMILNVWSEALEYDLETVGGVKLPAIEKEYILLLDRSAVTVLYRHCFFGGFIDLTNRAARKHYLPLERGRYVATFVYRNHRKRVPGLSSRETIWTGATNKVRCTILVQ